MENRDYIAMLLTKDDVVSEIKKEMDTLLSIIPEIESMIGFEHCHPHHHLNVWDHTLLALSYSKNDLKTRLAVLLHDSGKPLCYTQDGEIRHYRGHAEKSAMLAKAVLERLGFNEAFTANVVELVRRHDTPLREADIKADIVLSKELFEVQKCDSFAHNPEHNERRLDYISDIQAMLDEA